jgi:arsenate reductase
MKIFGIPNCGTIKKARAWLDDRDIAYEFHDYKKASIHREHLERWCSQLGWEKVVNRAGMTFRKLPDEKKQNLTEARAIALMLAQPGMIKRPIIESNGRCMAGFDEVAYRAAFGKKR